MRKRACFIVVLVVVMVAAFAATALASLSTGKVYSYKHNAASKTGTLVIKNAKGKKSFVVADKSNCGVSKGQSGDQIPCKSLGAAKYHGKPVRVTWQNPGGARLTTLVVVNLAG